jgi:hypothetical protein
MLELHVESDTTVTSCTLPMLSSAGSSVSIGSDERFDATTVEPSSTSNRNGKPKCLHSGGLGEPQRQRRVRVYCQWTLKLAATRRCHATEALNLSRNPNFSLPCMGTEMAAAAWAICKLLVTNISSYPSSSASMLLHTMRFSYSV